MEFLVSELQRLRRDIERYARDRDWEMHRIAVDALITYLKEHKDVV